MRFKIAYNKYKNGGMSQLEDAELLGGKRSHNGVSLTLQGSNLAAKLPGRGKHRKKRERKPLPGMMIHQDASKHEWIEGCQDDLIVTMDDLCGRDIFDVFNP